MINAFYTASVGVNQTQKSMDVVANNIANVNTDGFKRGQASFSDLMYTNVHPTPEDTRLKFGHGAKMNKVDIVHNQAGIKNTERKLDFAIVDDGYFAIETNDGIKYTRSGSFHASVEGDELYLVNGSSAYVLDQDGERITLENVDSPITPGIYVFENNDGLLIEGGLYFNETDVSGVAEVNTEAEFQRGFLESSNVDLAQTMADMMVSQRAFQFNSKMVQTADEVMQTVNGLRQ